MKIELTIAQMAKLAKLLALDYQNEGNEESFKLMNYLLANLGKQSFKKDKIETEYDIVLERIKTYTDNKIIELERKYENSERIFDKDKYIISQLDKWIDFKQILEDVEEASTIEFKNMERKVKHISVSVT